LVTHPYTKKQTTKPIVASLATNIAFGTNYMFIGSQNDPFFHEHVVQGPHIVQGKILPIFIHLSTPITRNYLSI